MSEEDKKAKELIDVRNLADTLVYTAEKSLRDFADKISDDVKKGVQEKIDALRGLKDSEDKEAIRKAADELSLEIQKIGASMSDQSTPAGAETAPDKKDAPVEGEYEEKK